MKIQSDKTGVPITPYYIRLPNRRAVIRAVEALLDDGAEFKVRAVGNTASITINNTRDWDILQQVADYPTRPRRFPIRCFKWLTGYFAGKDA